MRRASELASCSQCVQQLAGVRSPLSIDEQLVVGGSGRVLLALFVVMCWSREVTFG
jgi:hypothetical protein